MSCAARHAKNVLCFECYKSRLDVPPTRRFANVTLFPRVLSDQELSHRRKMLAHLRTFGRTAAPSHPRTVAPGGITCGPSLP